MKIEYEAQKGWRTLNQFDSYHVYRNGNGLWYNYTLKKWEEDLTSKYKMAANFCPCKSFRALMRHIKRGKKGIKKGDVVYIHGRYKGDDITITV
jgi:hypothetical protein